MVIALVLVITQTVKAPRHLLLFFLFASRSAFPLAHLPTLSLSLSLCESGRRPVCLHFYLKQTGIDYAKGYKSLEKQLYKLNQGLASFIRSNVELEK